MPKGEGVRRTTLQHTQSATIAGHGGPHPEVWVGGWLPTRHVVVVVLTTLVFHRSHESLSGTVGQHE